MSLMSKLKENNFLFEEAVDSEHNKDLYKYELGYIQTGENSGLYYYKSKGKGPDLIDNYTYTRYNKIITDAEKAKDYTKMEVKQSECRKLVIENLRIFDKAKNGDVKSMDAIIAMKNRNGIFPLEPKKLIYNKP